MVMTRSPLRVTLDGAGTDLPWDYREYGGNLHNVKDLGLRGKQPLEDGALGGGGFLMFYTEDPSKLRRAMTIAGLSEARFRFDFEGTKVIL